MKLNISKIKEKMESLKISQEKLARGMNCSLLKVNYLLKEKRDITLRDATRMAEVLNVKQKDILIFS